MQSKDTDTVLAELLEEKDATLRTVAIEILVERHAAAAVPAVLRMTHSADTRAVAIEALGAMGDESVLPRLLKLVKSRRDVTQDAAALAIASIGRRIGTSPAVDEAIGKAYERVRNTATRVALVKSLCDVGGEAGLALIRRVIAEAEPEVQDTGVRTLARWPTEAALPFLKDLAEHGARESHRILALRGCVRVLREVEGWTPARRLDEFKKTMALVARPEERRMVLSGVSTVASLEALAFAQGYLPNEKVRNEAAAAVVKIASAIAKDHRSEAMAALRGVLETCDGEELQETVKKILGRLEALR